MFAQRALETATVSLRAAMPVSGLIFMSRLLGVAREAVFAGVMGAGRMADAYVAAFRVPNLLRDLLAEGAFSSAFVPTYAALRKANPEHARAFASLVCSLMLLLTGALCALGETFASSIVAALVGNFGNDAGKVALTVALTRIMLPVLAFSSVGAVFMGMLNGERRFLVPALAPAVFNVAIIAAGLFLARSPANLSERVTLFAWATSAAGALQMLTQLGALMRSGFRPRLTIGGAWQHEGVRRVARLMGPAVISVAAVQLGVFLQTRFAANLGDGPLAQLGYAFRVFFVPLGMFGVALATIVTTSAAEAVAEGNTEALRLRTRDALQSGWMLVLASAIGLIILAEPTCRLLFEHGATTTNEARSIATLLQIYCIGLVPYGLVKVLAPVFFALDRPRIPLLASVTGVTVSVSLAALSYREFGAPALAGATATGAWINFVILRSALSRHVPNVVGARTVIGMLAQLALASGVLMGIATLAQWLLVPIVSSIGGSKLEALAVVVVGGGLAGLGFILTLRACGHPSAKTLLSLLARRKRG